MIQPTGLLRRASKVWPFAVEYSAQFVPYSGLSFYPTEMNATTFTLSTWFKIGSNQTGQMLFGARITSINYFLVNYHSDGRINIGDYISDTWNHTTRPTGVFVDSSAWYHLVVAYDTTQAVETERLRVYVNGQRRALQSSSQYPAYPSLNHEARWGNPACWHTIGLMGASINSAVYPFDGYMAEPCVVFGQALGPECFGEYSDKVPELWIPKKDYTIPWGVDDRRFPFSDAANLGYASVGEDVEVIGSPVQTTDTPTNNHCTLNPLDPRTTGTLSNGNLTTTGDASVTMRPVSGKWSYKKDGAEQLYDADVSGQFDPVLAAGTYTFGGYVPTSGYKLLTAANFPEPDVLDTSRYADVVLREGTGAEANITSLEFQPDFVNIKDRDTALSWKAYDSVRGATAAWSTDSTAIEETEASGLTAFGFVGYTLGDDADHNTSGDSYLDLALKAGAVPGLEVQAVSHTTGAATTINHSLGKPITFAIAKPRNLALGARVFHTALGQTKYLVLNSTNAVVTNSTAWPTNTSTQFALGSMFETGEYIVYLFTDSDVFKAFSFIGNGLTDGPFVDLGGRILSIPFLKNSAISSSWLNWDTLRTPVNPMGATINPHAADVEFSYDYAVVTANGMKPILGGTGSYAITVNGNGNLIIGLAILRQPQKYANAF